MQGLLLQFARRPWLWLALLCLASILAATQLTELRVKVSADEMLVIDDPQRAYYDRVKDLFGEQRLVLLVVEDPQILSAQGLDQLRGVIASLEALPFVAGTQSLFNIPHVKSVDGYLDKTAYLEPPPTTSESAAEVIRRALANPLLRDVLISSQGDAMAVAIILRGAPEQRDDKQLSLLIEQAAAPLHSVYREVYTIGFPQVRAELAERIIAEQQALVPFAVGALLIALFLLLRQLLDILTPLITAGISILWTFGLMGWLGIPINVVTSTVPILLIVVGSTEDIHLLAEFRHARRRGAETAMALQHMARKMGRTVLLTFITTCAGFLSVGLSGIEVLSQFGLIAAIGLMFNFIVTIVFIPAALALAGRWELDGRSAVFDDRTQRLAKAYWKWLSRWRWQILMALALVVAISLSGIPRIQINHSPTDSLGADSQVAQRIARLNDRFAGLESFSVVVESGIQDTFLQVRYLDEIIALQRFIDGLQPGLSTSSFADYLVLLNNAFLETEQAGPPRSNDEIAELMLFLEHERISGHVTADYSRTRIVVRHAITHTGELRGLLAQIQGFIDQHLDPGLSARITGDSMLTLSATRSMIDGQLQSVLLILGLFVLIVSFIFTDMRAGLLAALPNVFPVVVLFGVMGYTGIPLNIGTTMTAAIAIGIAVDGTLHFMLRYNQELRTSKSQTLAMQSSIHQEALPVIATSVALGIGFLVFGLSDFAPVAQFGMLSALVIFSALLADFLITPLAISALRLVTLWDLLSSRIRQQVIPRSPLFRDMRPWQIRKFVLSSTLLAFRPGEYVYRQHDPSQALYLVMTGVVEITVPQTGNQGEDPVVDQFGSGQIFGDVALLADEPRKTNAIALTHTTLMVLSREAIANVTHLHPFIAARLFLNLARDVSCRWVSFIVRVKGSTGSQPTGNDSTDKEKPE